MFVNVIQPAEYLFIGAIHDRIIILPFAFSSSKLRSTARDIPWRRNLLAKGRLGPCQLCWHRLNLVSVLCSKYHPDSVVGSTL